MFDTEDDARTGRACTGPRPSTGRGRPSSAFINAYRCDSWLAVPVLALSIVALVMSFCALVVAVLAMLATRRNAAVAVRKELREIAERDDAAGPRFEVEPTQVVERKAKVKIRIVGGPGAVAVSVRPAEVAWCQGVSSGDRDPAGEVWFPPQESGDVFTVTVHLTVEQWHGHTEGKALPLLLDAQSREEWPRRWERRVSAQLMPPTPPPPAPLGTLADDRLPDAW